MNGVLTKYVSGTSDVLKQIASKYALNQVVEEKLRSDKKKRKIVQKCEDVTLFGNGTLSAKTLKKFLSDVIPNSEISKCKFFKSCTINSKLIKCYNNDTKCDDSVIKSKCGEYHRVYYIFKLNDKVSFCTKEIKVSKSDSVLYPKYLRTIVGEMELQTLPSTEFAEKYIHIRTKNHSLLSPFSNNVERY